MHKKLVVACVRILDPKDGTVQSTLRKFGTMTADLMELRQWLVEAKVTHVAMESTGVYWQPVFNLLEGHFRVWVVNAQEGTWEKDRHEGRGVDSAAVAVWAVEAEFYPRPPAARASGSDAPKTKLVQQRNAVDNRVQKVLETANIKLGSVASDVLGVSGRKMIEALIAGEKEVTVVAELAQRKLREKIPELQRA